MKKLIANTAGLELIRGEDVRLPPVPGSFGPFIITGNANPTIRYIAFDEQLMEFVNVTVSLNLPDRITFEAATGDLGSVLPKDAYKEPFFTLADHLYRYFPLKPDDSRNLCPSLK